MRKRRRIAWIVIGLLLIAIAIWLQSFISAGVVVLLTALRLILGGIR